MSDSEILSSIKSGDERWIQACYKSLKQPFMRWITKQMSLDADVTAELFQSTLVTLYEKVQNPEFNLTSSLKTFFFAIGKNKALEYLKYKSRQQDLSLKEFTLAYQEDATEQALDFEEKLSVVLQAIQHLGEPCYTLLRFFYFEKLSWKEIALRMKYSDDHSAKNMKYKCLQKVRTLTEELQHPNISRKNG